MGYFFLKSSICNMGYGKTQTDFSLALLSLL